MPVVGINDVDNYKFQGDFGFLSLPNDKDVAKVRFYIESMDDLKFYVVHKVTDKQGNSRYVNCLRTYDQPIDDCPFCQQSITNKEFKTQVKMFLPVLDMQDNQVKIFERGRTFKNELEGVIRRNSPLVNYPCEIERNGEKGSTDTVYKVYPLAQEKDNTMIADLPEEPDLLDGYIIEMSIDEMNDFLNTGVLPGGSSNKQEENLPRRTSRTQNEASDNSVQRTNRRTASRF